MVKSRVVTVAWPALPKMTVAGCVYRVHYKLHNQPEDQFKLGLEAPAEACGRYEQEGSANALESTFGKLHRYMKERISTVNAIFWEFDKDRSGHIDVNEFQRAMAKIEAPLSDEEAQAVFDHIDGHGNSDGRVEYKELVTALKSFSRPGTSKKQQKQQLMGVALEGLELGARYSVRVTANSGESSCIQFVNLDTVRKVQAKTTSVSTVELSWEASAGASHYSVQQQDNNSWVQAVQNLTTTTCTMSNLLAGSSYCFRVIAGFKGNFEELGSIVDHTQPAAQPHKSPKGAPNGRLSEKALEKKVDCMMDARIQKLQMTGVRTSECIRKTGRNQYQIGTKKLTLNIINSNLVVRLGGQGQQNFDEFLEKHRSLLYKTNGHDSKPSIAPKQSFSHQIHIA